MSPSEGLASDELIGGSNELIGAVSSWEVTYTMIVLVQYRYGPVRYMCGMDRIRARLGYLRMRVRNTELDGAVRVYSRCT